MMRKCFALWPRSALFWVLLGAIVAAGVVFDAIAVFGIEWTGDRFPPELWETLRTYHAVVSMALISAGGFLYGVHRMLSFHPTYNEDYLDWLVCTPYEGREPLPLGLVHVSWWDLTFLAPFSLLTFLTPYFPWYAAIALAIASYLLSAGFTFYVSGLKRQAYTAAVGLAFAVALIEVPWAAALILLVLLGISWQAIHLSLSREALSVAGENPFFREAKRQFNVFRESNQTTTEPTSVFAGASSATLVIATPEDLVAGDTRPDKPANIGVPLAVIGPFVRGPALPVSDCLALSTIAGLWTIAAFLHLPWTGNLEDSFGAAAIFDIISLPLLIGQTASLLEAKRPPISLLGRIGTGRLVVPGFDQVFIRLLVVLTLPWGIFYFSWLMNIPAIYGLGLSVAIGVLVMILGPPRYRRWVLLGHCRVAKAFYPGLEASHHRL